MVSVIIPTYNYGRYIANTIDSVLNQKNVKFELIVVDDGSTDNTLEIILKKYKEKVRWIRQKNGGAPAARNAGLNIAKGEKILFLDADDRLMPGALSSRCEYLMLHQNVDWVYGPVRYQDEFGDDATMRYRHTPFAHKHKRSGNILPFLMMGELIHLPSVMVKKATVNKAGGFDESLPCLQDYDLWLKIAAISSVGYIDETNVLILDHPGSISRSKSDGYQTRLKIMEAAEKRYPDVIRQLGTKWDRYYGRIIAERGRHLIRQGNATDGCRLIRQAIARNPLHFRHYIGYAKGCLKCGSRFFVSANKREAGQ